MSRTVVFVPRAAHSAFALLVLLGPWGSPAVAQAPTIGKLEQYTENRGPNEAGLGPTYQLVVTASVVPSGYPTLVFAERGAIRHPLTHLGTPSAPDPELYALWLPVDQAVTASWRIVAERGDLRSKPAATHALANPWKVPLAKNVRVSAGSATPRVSWVLPDLAGQSIQRIRVVVRGGQRVHGRFLSVLFVSQGLPATATDFTFPPGVLAVKERYVFQVMLENVEGGELTNRSSTFSEPYTVSRQ